MAKSNPAQALPAAHARIRTLEASLKRQELEHHELLEERNLWRSRAQSEVTKRHADIDVSRISEQALHTRLRTAKLDVVRWRLVSVTLAIVLGATILGIVL